MGNGVFEKQLIRMPDGISAAEFRRALSGTVDRNQDEVAIFVRSEENQLEVESVGEKPLEGEESPILRKLKFVEDTSENVRLCLFYGTCRTYAVFGGENSSLLEPSTCKRIFDKIESENDFYRLSNLVREDVNAALKI